MPRKVLSQEEIVTMRTLKEKGLSNSAIARAVGVTEGAVRYRMQRASDRRPDGRRSKASTASAYEQAIRRWVAANCDIPPGRDPTPQQIHVRALYDWLVFEHRYTGSYRSVLRFVHKAFPQARLRPYRRVELPPGAQAQVDWFEERVHLADRGQTKLYGFIMTLSHSRMSAVVWRTGMSQLHWHAAHNEAFRRLGGIPAVIRIDNLKTGMAHGSGPWGTPNPAYLQYAREAGFHIDACLVRHPHHKGKVERHIADVRGILGLPNRVFDSMDDLQDDTDKRMIWAAQQRLCPPTGQSVAATWESERKLLRPIDRLPEVFDVSVLRTVSLDCLVSFEGRRYGVPFVHCGRQVEVRGTADKVEIYWEGRKLVEYARGTDATLLIDESTCYEGPGDDRVASPLPLGKIGRRIQELASAEVELRSADYYAVLAEEVAV